MDFLLENFWKDWVGTGVRVCLERLNAIRKPPSLYAIEFLARLRAIDTLGLGRVYRWVAPHRLFLGIRYRNRVIFMSYITYIAPYAAGTGHF